MCSPRELGLPRTKVALRIYRGTWTFSTWAVAGFRVRSRVSTVVKSWIAVMFNHLGPLSAAPSTISTSSMSPTLASSGWPSWSPALRLLPRPLAAVGGGCSLIPRSHFLYVNYRVCSVGLIRILISPPSWRQLWMPKASVQDSVTRLFSPKSPNQSTW